MDKLLLSIPEAAAALCCSTGAIRKWLHQGRLWRVKIGKRTCLHTSHIEAVAKKGLPPKGTYPREIRTPATKGLPASAKIREAA